LSTTSLPPHVGHCGRGEVLLSWSTPSSGQFWEDRLPVCSHISNFFLDEYKLDVLQALRTFGGSCSMYCVVANAVLHNCAVPSLVRLAVMMMEDDGMLVIDVNDFVDVSLSFQNAARRPSLFGRLVEFLGFLIVGVFGWCNATLGLAGRRGPACLGSRSALWRCGSAPVGARTLEAGGGGISGVGAPSGAALQLSLLRALPSPVWRPALFQLMSGPFCRIVLSISSSELRARLVNDRHRGM